MKKFRILLSFLLIFCMFSFVGCNKLNDNNGSGTNNDQTGTQTEEKLTASDVLRLSYDKLVYNLVTKTSLSKNFSNGDGKNHYDFFVSKALNIVKKVTEISDFKFNKVYTGETIEPVQDDTSKLSQVRYLTATSTEKSNIFEISLVIVLSKTNFDTNPLNFMLMKINLDYNTNTNELECDCDIENRFSNAIYNSEDTVSRSDYYYFHFDSKWNRYDGAYFHRASTKVKNFNNLEYVSVETIKNFNIVSFNFLTMQNDMQANYTTIDQNKEQIQSIILRFEELKNIYLQLETAEEETKTLTETLIPIFASIPELG